MKQKIYILGVVTALVVFTGAIFKVNHFPGAGILLTLGLLTMVFLFLPLALVNHYKSEESSKNLLLYIVTWLTCFVIFITMLFKFMHWPGAGILLTIALPFPYVVFLPVFLGATAKNKNFNIYNTVFVLLLLALNSVFSVLLALNVSFERIDDSYDLSRNYNNVATVLKQVPDEDEISLVNLKIDEVLKIVDESQDLILKNLKQEDISIEQWKNNPGYLRRPDIRGVAFQVLYDSSDGPGGENLVNGLKELIGEMNKTPGYENFAKNAPLIFDFHEQAGNEKEWVSRIFNDNNLAWALIYLDGLRANLLLIRSSVP
jgi:hypothetical protein